MNRFILKNGRLVTFVILAILAWFVYRQFIVKGSPFLPFAIMTGVIWVIGTFVFLYIWPRMTYSAYKRALLQKAPGGPIPVNTFYAIPKLASASASDGSLLSTGTDSILYVNGWLELSDGPLVLHVPDFMGRYYSLQFTDPSTGTNFAYVGKRTTGTRAGDFLVSAPGWQGSVPQGMRLIASTNRSVMVVGRVFVENDGDMQAAYELAKQVQVIPFDA